MIHKLASHVVMLLLNMKSNQTCKRHGNELMTEKLMADVWLWIVNVVEQSKIGGQDD